MTVLKNDMVKFVFEDGDDIIIPLNRFENPSWPPPEKIEVFGLSWARTAFSKLTDEQADHPNIARGALYYPVK